MGAVKLGKLVLIPLGLCLIIFRKRIGEDLLMARQNQTGQTFPEISWELAPYFPLLLGIIFIIAGVVGFFRAL